MWQFIIVVQRHSEQATHCFAQILSNCIVKRESSVEGMVFNCCGMCVSIRFLKTGKKTGCFEGKSKLLTFYAAVPTRAASVISP